MTVLSVRSFLVSTVGGEQVRVEKTHCFWCANRDYVCSQCVAELDKAVAERRLSQSQGEKP